MRPLFFTSLTSAFVSLLAALGFSAMTIVPSPHAESLRARWLLACGAFFVGWLSLAFWSRPQQGVGLPPSWLRGLLVAFGIIYCLAVFLLVLG